MSGKKNLVIILLLAVITVLFYSCDVNPPDTDGLDSPDNVNAELVGGYPVVSWEDSEGAEGYTVYVSEDGGDFVEVGQTSGEMEFTDPVPFGASDLQFAVRSFAGSNHSPLSAPSGVIFVNVQNLFADKFNSPSKIDLRWDRHEHAESYTVIRFDAASQDVSDATTLVSEMIVSDLLLVISYDDTTAEMDETYWYRVYWNHEDGSVNGQDVDMELGICSGEADYNEPDNNDYMNLPVLIDPADGSAAGVVSPISNYFYSVNDGSGSRFDDIDWFGISDPLNTAYSIEFVFSDISDPQQFDPETEINVYARYGNNSILLDSANAVGDTFTYVLSTEIANAGFPVFFKLVPIVSASDDRYGQYTFQVTDGF